MGAKSASKSKSSTNKEVSSSNNEFEDDDEVADDFYDAISACPSSDDDDDEDDDSDYDESPHDSKVCCYLHNATFTSFLFYVLKYISLIYFCSSTHKCILCIGSLTNDHVVILPF